LTIGIEPTEGRIPRVLAAIPSLNGDVTRLETLTDILAAVGMRCLIAATGRALDLKLAGSRVPYLSPMINAGFGQTITHVADSTLDWDWLAIVNDDISVDEQQLRQSLKDVLARDPKDRVLAYMDPVRAKEMPTLASVLASVSMVGPVIRRLRKPKMDGITRTDPHRYFRPFSFAIVSRGLWEELNGFDPSMLYTFEDADFGRRAALASADVLFVENTGVTHSASSTSRRHMDRVLPVAAWSACAYLEKWAVPRPMARVLCVAALLVRLAAVPVADIPRVKHLQGIGAAVVALLAQRQPSLPDYKGN
jgi:GT2 family glycosyltransferase